MYCIRPIVPRPVSIVSPLRPELPSFAPVRPDPLRPAQHLVPGLQEAITQPILNGIGRSKAQRVQKRLYCAPKKPLGFGHLSTGDKIKARQVYRKHFRNSWRLHMPLVT